ncbi:MAG TPA: carbohydrate-binding domain-containing protein [Aeromicrobium sp.]|nr:carbohydrate-binding domain-containing protein [Aeromicrobium sp.]
MTSATLPLRVPSAALALVLLTAAGCSQAADDADGTDGGSEKPAAPEIAKTHAKADDGDYDRSDATTIKLADGSSKVTGDGATVKGDVITISEAGTYLLSGSLSDGQVDVNSEGDGKVKLVLDGVDIESASTSPLVVTAADEAVVILADGAKNTLSDAAAASADDEKPDAPTATLYSGADLTIAGTGSLTVNGESNDGIASKDGLVILAGTVAVDAVDDAIGGKDYLVVDDGTLSVTAGGDGLKSNGDTPGELGWLRFDGGAATIEAVSDGVSAEGSIDVTGGTVDVTKSDDGVKAPVVAVSGGTVSVTAINDGVKTSSGADAAPGAAKVVEEGVALTISGGTVNVDAGGDGIDSKGTATITGGVVTIGKAGKNAIDVVGTAKTPDEVTLSLGSPGKVELKDTQGGVVASFTATKAGSRVLMSDRIKSGETYSVSVDGNETGTVTATARP